MNFRKRDLKKMKIDTQSVSDLKASTELFRNQFMNHQCEANESLVSPPQERQNANKRIKFDY